MGRRGWVLAVGAAGTLLVSAFASAAAPVSIFAGETFGGGEAKAPGEEYGTTQVDNVRDLGRRGTDTVSQDWFVTLLGWALKAAVLAVVVVLLVAVARALLERVSPRQEAEAETGVTEDLTPDALLAAAREGEAALETGSPANAVVAAWVRLEEAARTAGIAEDRSRTAAELVGTVLRRYAVDPAALDTLAELYREARFSGHEVDESMRDRARDALRQVSADLSAARPQRHTSPRTAGAAR